MDYNSFFSFVDIIVFGGGFYALYAAWMLKREGKINQTLMLFKDTDINACKDLQGFANYMAPKLSALGAAMIVYGGISMLDTYVLDIDTLFFVVLGIFFLVLIWYAFACRRALSRYW